MKKQIKDNKLFVIIRDFLIQYLPKQRFCSVNTIESYRTALNLLLDYICKTLDIELSEVTFIHITPDVLTQFLDWLENDRGCSVSTRNQRLACIRAFYKYAGMMDFTLMAYRQELMKIPLKKVPVQLIVKYLDEDSLRILLRQPDSTKPKEFRNLFYMILMYDTGCRNQEILDLRLTDIHTSDKTPYIIVNGNGNKTRIVPLMNKTIQYFEKYKSLFHKDSEPNSYLFYTIFNNFHKQMSPDNVARFVKKYGEQAFAGNNSMAVKVHPHILRHSRAIHLYRGGMSLPLLSEWLGHANLETTMIYAYADTEMKRQAIQKATTSLNPLLASTDIALPINKDMIKTLYGLR